MLFVFFLILGFQSLGQRYAKIGERDGTKYYIHEVSEGETLYGIQTLYGVDMDKIKESNNLSQNIEVGQRLYIPIRYHDVNHTVRNKEITIEGEIPNMDSIINDAKSSAMDSL